MLGNVGMNLGTTDALKANHQLHGLWGSFPHSLPIAPAMAFSRSWGGGGGWGRWGGGGGGGSREGDDPLHEAWLLPHQHRAGQDLRRLRRGQSLRGDGHGTVRVKTVGFFWLGAIRIDAKGAENKGLGTNMWCVTTYADT